MAVPMRIDIEACSKCGLCAAICPVGTIDQPEDQFPARNPARASLCEQCGQCMAVCPSASIVVGDFSYERDFLTFDRPEDGADYPAFFSLAATRRAVRRFQDRPVPRELLEQVVAAVALAPMGFPPHKTAVTVVSNRAAIAEMVPHVVKFYEKLLTGMKSPLIRFFIKRGAGPEHFPTLAEHLVPKLAAMIPAMKASGRDEISREAPALLLLHAKRTAANHTQDANIALGYGLLAAHSLGLGATANGLLPPAINATPALRAMLHLPTDHEVVSSMILGYPRHRYVRSIRRKLAGVTFM
ncbi:MAG TPA: nitroreductase family protein [Symbiobacteriaceae bacterium]|nr:nitroreductase family protein [Symbiobacteriaceae bacterium]